MNRTLRSSSCSRARVSLLMRYNSDVSFQISPNAVSNTLQASNGSQICGTAESTLKDAGLMSPDGGFQADCSSLNMLIIVKFTIRVLSCALGIGQDKVVAALNRDVSYPPSTRLPDVFPTAIRQLKQSDHWFWDILCADSAV